MQWPWETKPRKGDESTGPAGYPPFPDRSFLLFLPLLVPLSMLQIPRIFETQEGPES